MQTPNMARFFLASTDPHYLKDAPGGNSYLNEDAAVLQRGKIVFAERCARCHSSKLPPLPAGLDLENANGPDYLTAWNAYWNWTKTDAFKAPMRELVLRDDFLKGNFLSTELRVPITLLGINACSPLATNAIRGNIWDNFSSESYKTLPPVGTIKIRHPVSGQGDGLHAAGRRPRLHPARVARQRLVHRAVPAEQHRRTVRVEPVGRRADAFVPAVDRADAVARAARQGSAVCERESVPASA